MDFAYSEEQKMLRDLAREILEKEVTPERLKQVEADEAWFDAVLWSKLAEANLLGVAVPEAHGGMGMGLGELGMLLVELGRALAPVPAVAALVTGGLPLAELGDDAQRERFLPRLVSGEGILTSSIGHAPGAGGAGVRGVRDAEDAAGWRLDGLVRWVPAVHLAERVLVPAAAPDGDRIFLVDPNASGVRRERNVVSRGEPVFDLHLDGVRVPDADVLAGGGADAATAVQRLRERAVAATCAVHLGVLERALEITTDYLKERHQFGAPIGSFPAVQHRAANCFIDVEAVRWTTWRAIWRLAEGLPAAREVAVAKYWAADAGRRIVAATQHLHGGIGVDLDYPIHRTFLWSKSLELCFGSATHQLRSLGRHMASAPPREIA